MRCSIKVRAQGAAIETNSERKATAAAYRSDPFGNGFCVIGPNA